MNGKFASGIVAIAAAFVILSLLTGCMESPPIAGTQWLDSASQKPKTQ